ncbi:hypothetical protein F4678DRAFT_312106 [Xylaria arbuscula]|nr:hypothetical protein F4678DRAFT_312106 [Xylaria arbuscula]
MRLLIGPVSVVIRLLPGTQLTSGYTGFFLRRRLTTHLFHTHILFSCFHWTKNDTEIRSVLAQMLLIELISTSEQQLRSRQLTLAISMHPFLCMAPR